MEKDNKLHLNDTLHDWLPNYDKWSDITIKSLINMTSDLPNYSDTPLWNVQEYQQPSHNWTNEELIAFVYPANHFSPPRRAGYFYFNTGYVLADFIIEKASQQSF